MFDAQKLLGQMLQSGRSMADSARAKVQAEVHARLGDDPLATIQAMGKSAVEKLGPEAKRAAAAAGSLARVIGQATRAADALRALPGGGSSDARS